jgi:hypothetical protein
MQIHRGGGWTHAICLQIKSQVAFNGGFAFLLKKGGGNELRIEKHIFNIKNWIVSISNLLINLRRWSAWKNSCCDTGNRKS